jgi:gluconokinase
VFACSALKESYRQRLAAPGDVRFVYLKGDREAIMARCANRTHDYMPASLVDSQFAALEEPADAVVIDIREELSVKVAAIRAAFALDASAPA